MATHFQYSCLEKSTDRGAWQAAVHGVTCLSTSMHEEGGARWVGSNKLVELKQTKLSLLLNINQSSHLVRLASLFIIFQETRVQERI